MEFTDTTGYLQGGGSAANDYFQTHVQLTAGGANFSVEGILRGEGGEGNFVTPISPPWGVRGHPNFFWW